jgi:hypothetical protein
MSVALTSEQLGVLSQIELCAHMLKAVSKATAHAGANILTGALITAAKTIEAAHGEYIAETQRAVSIAGPSDIQAVLHDKVKL